MKRAPRSASRSSDVSGVAGPTARPRPGGRSARVQTAVLNAALDVLQRTGLRDFTIAEVAERAGVHPTSIYRRWRDRDSLVQEACVHFAATAFAVPDTGSLRADLAALVRQIIAMLRSPQGQAMLALTQSGQPHVEGTRRAFWRRRLELLQPMFDRARARGELADHVDTKLLLESVVAPLYLRAIVTGESLDEWPYMAAIDQWLSPLPPPGQARDPADS
jgi:AcrR family transcriptional regulator